MLERSAGGLESAGLQRLLRQRTKARDKCRRPHALFWQHGAPEPELPPARDGFVDMFTPNPAKTEPLSASTFLLDFLYPGGALALMGKVSWGLVDCQKAIRRAAGDAAAVPKLGRLYSSFPRSAATTSDAAKDLHALPSALGGEGHPTVSTWAAVDDGASMPEQLEALLQASSGGGGVDSATNDRAWHLYSRLDGEPAKSALARRLLLFLAPSPRPADAQRITRLFGEVAARERDAAVVYDTIRAHLALQDRAGALSVFQSTAPEDAVGMGLLVADALQTGSWARLAEVWAAYQAKKGRDSIDPAEVKEVARVPQLQEKLERLSEAVLGGEPWPAEGVSPRNLYAAMLSASLATLRAGSVSFRLVERLQSRRVYDDFIQVALDNKKTELAAAAFAAYRQLPGYKPRQTTLVRMVREVYYPQDARGMEEVLKDWYSARGRPSYWGYQKYLSFYAGRGDVRSVYRLWNEFTATFPSALERGEDTFAHLLKVHAVRGDVARLEQVFAEIGDKYGAAASVVCWNIRLHAHVERGHVREAMHVFEALCAAVAPDDYSFGTILSLAGGRGDLALARALYRLARACGVRITEAVLDPLVEAYCQNDQFAEAERLCTAATRERRTADGRYTALWNTLLQHHAFRHDLAAVSRILALMTRLQVAYDQGTYSALLLALAQCRQPRRALELLRAAQDDGLFRPTAHHYTLLMMAYIRSKLPHRALQVNRLMHHLGFQRSSQQTQMVIKAFSQWAEYPDGPTAPARRDLFAKALREFQRSLVAPDHDPMRAQQSLDRDAARMPLGAVRRFSFVIFMLVQARDFAGVQEIIDLYRTVAPPDERQLPLPLKLCNALMLSDFYEGRFDRVKETWDYVFSRSQEIGRPLTLDPAIEALLLARRSKPGEPEPVEKEPGEPKKQPSTIVAKLRYGLSDPLKTMQRLCAAERNPDALVQLVADVRAAGFRLDSKNWNHYVQNLARLGRTQEAFVICEQQLMGQWSGFAVLRARRRDRDGTATATATGTATPTATATATATATPPHLTNTTGSARLSRTQQLRESASRYNRPMTYTFMVLAKAYLELERSAPWLSSAERQFHDLAVRCPKSVHAVRTMVRMNSRIEGRVFGPEDHPADHFGDSPFDGGGFFDDFDYVAPAAPAAPVDSSANRRAFMGPSPAAGASP